MLISFDKVPYWLLWTAVGVSVLTWVVTVFLVGRRYWWLSFAVPLLAGFTLLIRGGPGRTFAHSMVLYCVTVLSFAISFLWQLPRLRAAYAENPDRELGKLMTERQQLQLCAVFGVSAAVLYFGTAVLCGGFIS